MSKKGIETAARESSGKSRKCGTCPLCTFPIRCTPEISRICNESHIEGFKKARYQQENSIERELVELFDKNYGREEIDRMIYLLEELKELNEESLKYFNGNSKTEYVLDEMSDVVAIIAHICSIFGTNISNLLKQAYDKVKGRETDPNYLRRHTHV